MQRITALAIVQISFVATAFAQTVQKSSPEVEGVYAKKSFAAQRAYESPKVDGSLEDLAWQNLVVATDFVADRPDPGKRARHQTEVRMVYDDEAIYVAIHCLDSAPDSILNQLSGRDNDGNSDYCGITFSPYRDGQNGWTFAVSPSGEQFDAQESATLGEDATWNAVWQCETSITSDGWIAEFKIPYAALRFPDVENQLWEVNFFREVRRLREHSFWNAVDPQVPGYMTQLGTLSGISNIDPPVRLFFYPFASTYVNIQDNGNGTHNTTTSYNGGMDVKFGISESFTLDATLIPDFGQTVSDALVLNLTPFEVRFDENRQFFTEGTELFSKGDLFYSRRVGFIAPGYTPSVQLAEHENFKTIPFETQLINATKVSGRTQHGTGIGIFNAISAPENAVVVGLDGSERWVEYYPLANYNVLVVDQNLRNNSSVTFMNASVIRDGSAYDSNVTGTEFNIRNKKLTYAVRGGGAYNRKFNWLDDNDDGYTYRLQLAKISGNFRVSTGYSVESDTYDPNDLGFLYNNNSSEVYVSANYNIYQPFGRFNNMWSYLFSNYTSLFNPRHFGGVNISGGVGFNTKKFLSYELSFENSPVENYDFFEPRIDGLFFLRPKYTMLGAWISTDYRKTLAWDLGTWAGQYSNEGHYMFNYRIAPRWRVNDKLMFTYVYSRQNQYNDLGFARFSDEGDPTFGRRDVISHTNVLTASYAFNPLMGITCRTRHYWGFSRYHQYYDLGMDGHLLEQGNLPLDAENSSNISFNSFSVDMVFRWIFSPGSEMTVVWKNNIFGAVQDIPNNLADDIRGVFDLPQSNSFSIKVLYFMDYQSIFGHGRKNKA